MSLNIIHKHTDTVVTSRQRGSPRKGYVRQPNSDRDSNIRQEGTQLSIPPAEMFRSFQDGIKSPAREAVNVQANKDTLVKHAGTSLKARSRKEEKSQEVMMDSEVEVRNRYTCE